MTTLQRILGVTMKKGIGRELGWLTRSQKNSTNLTAAFFAVQTRPITSQRLTKNMTLLSDEKQKMDCSAKAQKPLVVLLPWLMAQRKHVHKYADIYLRHGFDVLDIGISPWQLLWPVKGSQVVARQLLDFLESNADRPALVLHGFSVGAYLWSEALVNIAAQQARYAPLVGRIVGQVWDSAADVTEISKGLPVAVFPRNRVLQRALQQYVVYHMKTFDKVATVHYVRASQMFHTNLVRAPAQIFISKADPIGTEESNLRAKESWENMGIRVNWKCWDKSPHVGHYRMHPKEYVAALESFLDGLQLPRAVSSASEGDKAEAKL